IVERSKVEFSVSPKHTGQGDDRAYSLAEKTTLVAKNAKALKVFREGLPFAYQEPAVRSAATLLPHFAKFRNLARLLALESQVRASHGDYNSAFNSCLDCIQMGQMIPRGGILLGMLVGSSCQGIGQRSAGLYIEHLNATQCRPAAKRLEAIIAQHVPYADV